MRVAVVGAKGQLGGAIVEWFRGAHDVIPLTRADADITSDAAVAATMARVRPEVIINCAAFNDVDGAEDRPVDALNVNAFSVRSLARAAVAADAIFVHYSTDFVFDGTASAPYMEDVRPNPRSVYAASKLLGEWFAADAPRSYVLRVESLFGTARGGSPAKGTVEAIRKMLTSGQTPRVFEDRTVSPTYVPDAARATAHLIEIRAPYGLYHCVNSGHCTWLEFARDLAHQMGVEPRLEAIRLADLQLRASRPAFCALSNDKLAATGFTMPDWRDALRRYIDAGRV